MVMVIAVDTAATAKLVSHAARRSGATGCIQ